MGFENGAVKYPPGFTVEGNFAKTPDELKGFVTRGPTPFISAEAFGIANDGTDQTTKIQQAIDAASVVATQFGGCEVRFGPGTFGYTALLMKSFVTIRGAGRVATVLKQLGASVGITFSSLSFASLQSLNVQISNADPAVVGIDMANNCQSVTLFDIDLFADVAVSGQIGLRLRPTNVTSCYWNTILGCSFRQIGGAILLDTVGAGNQANANMFSSVRIHNFLDFGIKIANGSDNQFTNIQCDTFPNATAVLIQNSSLRNQIQMKAEGGVGSRAISVGALATGNVIILTDECPVAPEFLTPDMFISFNGLIISQSLSALFEARMQRDSATKISLQRYSGRWVYVNGELKDPGASAYEVNNTDHLISATGTDSGAAPAVNTLYYAYVSSNKASYSPNNIRLSATAPSLYNGVKYLGTSGNAAEWRFVGWVRTISNAGTVNFADSTTQRLVVNYYNRLKKVIGPICPGYVDDNNYTNQNIVTGGLTNWTAVNTGANEQSSFISNGEDAIEWELQSFINNTGGNLAALGVALDGLNPTSAHEVAAGDFVSGHSHDRLTPAEGYHTLDMVYSTDGATTIDIYWDSIRRGATADPKLTLYTAMVMA